MQWMGGWSIFQKSNTHFIGFLFIVGVMAVSVFFSVGHAVAKSITVNKKNFPDKELRKELDSEGVAMGDKITRRELKAIKGLTMTAKKRKLNYKGVELFPNITYMDLTECSKVVKLPEASRLEELDYGNDAMQRMSVRQYPQLKTVSIWGERLVRLDLSKNSQLKHLSLEAPNLIELDLSRLKKLEKLELFLKELKQLDLSQNKRLKVLMLEYIRGSAIHLPSLPRLEELTIDHSDIETLDLTGFRNLKKISIFNCEKLQSIRLQRCRSLVTVNAQNCSKLQEIDADDSIQLKTLKFSQCEKMIHLDSLDLSKLKRLELWKTIIYNLSSARFPKLKKLSLDLDAQSLFDFQSLKGLVSLEISDDRTIRVLDVSMLPKLSSLSWRFGVVKKVKFGKKSRFKKIDLFGNQLSGAWNLSKFKNLNMFDCCNNKITSLDLGKSDQKLDLYCYNNRLKKINAKHVPKLSDLECWGNRGVKVYLHSRKKKHSEWQFDKTTKVYY